VEDVADVSEMTETPQHATAVAPRDPYSSSVAKAHNPELVGAPAGRQFGRGGAKPVAKPSTVWNTRPKSNWDGPPPGAFGNKKLPADNPAISGLDVRKVAAVQMAPPVPVAAAAAAPPEEAGGRLPTICALFTPLDGPV
jgi:hypothetical protein